MNIGTGKSVNDTEVSAVQRAAVAGTIDAGVASIEVRDRTLNCTSG